MSDTSPFSFDDDFVDVPPLPESEERTSQEPPAANPSAFIVNDSISPSSSEPAAAMAYPTDSSLRGDISTLTSDLLTITEAVLKVQNASTDAIVSQTAAALGTNTEGQLAIVTKLLAGAKRSRDDTEASIAALANNLSTNTTVLDRRDEFTKSLMQQAVRHHSASMESTRALSSMASLDIERQAALAALTSVSGGLAAVAAQRATELNPNNAAYVIAMSQLQALEQTQKDLVTHVADTTRISTDQLIEITKESAQLQTALATERLTSAHLRGSVESLQTELQGYNNQLAALHATLAAVTAESEASRAAAAKYDQEVAINRALEQHLDLKGIATAVIKANAPPIIPQNVPAPNVQLRKAAPNLFAIRFLQHKNCSISELIVDWEQQVELRQKAEERAEELEADRQKGLKQVAATLVALKEEILRRQNAEKWVERHSLERIPTIGNDSARRELSIAYAELSNAKDEIARLKVSATERKMSRDSLSRKCAELEREVEQLRAATHASELVQAVAATHATFTREQQRLCDALSASLSNAKAMEVALEEATRRQAASDNSLAASKTFATNVSAQLDAMTRRAEEAERQLIEYRKEIATQLQQVTAARASASAQATAIAHKSSSALPASVVSHMQNTEKLLQRLVESVTQINTNPLRASAQHDAQADVASTSDDRIRLLQEIVASLASRLMAQAQRTDLVQATVASQLQSDLKVRDELLEALADQQRINETTIRKYEAIIDKHGLQAGESLLQQDPTTSSEALGKIRSLNEQVDDTSSGAHAHRAEEMISLQRKVSELQTHLASKTLEAEAQANELTHVSASLEVQQRILTNTANDLDQQRALCTALRAEVDRLRLELDSERAQRASPLAEVHGEDNDNASSHNKTATEEVEAFQKLVVSVTEAMNQLSQTISALPEEGMSAAELARLADPQSAQRTAIASILKSFADMKQIVADTFSARAKELSDALHQVHGDEVEEGGTDTAFETDNTEDASALQARVIRYATRRLRIAAPAPEPIYVEPTEEVLKATPLYKEIEAALESTSTELNTEKEKNKTRNSDLGRALASLQMANKENQSLKAENAALQQKVAEYENGKVVLTSPPMGPLSTPNAPSGWSAPQTPLEAPKPTAPFGAPASKIPSTTAAAAAAAAAAGRPKGAAAAAAAAGTRAPPPQPTSQAPTPFGTQPPPPAFGSNAFAQGTRGGRGAGGRGWRGGNNNQGWN